MWGAEHCHPKFCVSCHEIGSAWQAGVQLHIFESVHFEPMEIEPFRELTDTLAAVR